MFVFIREKKYVLHESNNRSFISLLFLKNLNGVLMGLQQRLKYKARYQDQRTKRGCNE